ncbi:hypothetical protein NSQ51_10055 [Geobacillus sp. FSL K6-0789]|uniref:Uncharacterized protein n=2 Tax=Geobacillus stearothermophilus TaxID=1422 RepID=A0A087LDI1_GEOSE|nr:MULTISPECIES: hypothetical protein [Geobacillus]AKM19451.1 hypothetical protein GARCT_02198 [Geobacillus sp. 12AMOR1]AKU25578.1 hypothetical protein IB49_02880 [Geobacillus sp. LC300]ASS86357.1 hypothetical protein GLN3_04030 [Geobacillus lituanicus]MED0653032.1 hypothetical protein [Anoxybacillus geothermalis]STO12601.1 Uncharacterised protein [[Flavobacterium] thermophilum]
MTHEKMILAVITINGEAVAGGAPIFVCRTKEEMERIAANLEAILDGIAHELSDGLLVIVKH